MNAMVYYLSLPFIYLVSYLPFWMLYRLSDLCFVVVYYLVGYRKQVVGENLRKSFPEKTDAEIRAVRKKFYRYFCDLILETFKTLTISPKTLRKRVRFAAEDQEAFAQFYREQQSVMIVMGHWGNWEIAGARFAVEDLHPLYIVYHPLRNPYFEKLVYHMRTRLGNGLYAMRDTLRQMVKHRKALTATAFIADQTPHNLLTAIWTDFMGRETPVFPGPEILSQKFNYPIIYVGTRRLKRGYYQLECEVLAENPKAAAPEEITRAHIQRLEKDIRDQPEIWLWTHRRWKHRKPKHTEPHE